MTLQGLLPNPHLRASEPRPILSLQALDGSCLECPDTSPDTWRLPPLGATLGIEVSPGVASLSS